GPLQVQLELTGPGVATSANSPAAGRPAVLQSIAINTTGSYTFTVSGLGGTSGTYTIQVDLNAALSSAAVGGASNQTLATAQSVDPSFVTLTGSAQRGAVLGTLAGGVGPDGFGYTAISIAPQFTDISGTGTSILVGSDNSNQRLNHLSGFS